MTPDPAIFEIGRALARVAVARKMADARNKANRDHHAHSHLRPLLERTPK